MSGEWWVLSAGGESRNGVECAFTLYWAAACVAVRRRSSVTLSSDSFFALHANASASANASSMCIGGIQGTVNYSFARAGVRQLVHTLVHSEEGSAGA